MYRLIQLHVIGGAPHIGVETDGFVAERAAMARQRATPASFGVGRFGADGKLVEIVMGGLCGPAGGCPRPATVVHAETYHRLCDTCALGVAVLTVAELALRLGVAVRPASVLARSGRHAAADDGCAVSTRIAREFAVHVGDPTWRMELCGELSRTPSAVNGLLIGVGALSHRDVLDLAHILRTLGGQLPGTVQADLLRATARPLSPAGVAALRLGL
jgi:hypothetical protein